MHELSDQHRHKFLGGKVLLGLAGIESQFGRMGFRMAENVTKQFETLCPTVVILKNLLDFLENFGIIAVICFGQHGEVLKKDLVF